MSQKERGERKRQDPGLSFRFYVAIDGIFLAEFVECGGLNIEREVRTLEEGGVNDRVHVFPGRIKHGNVTLKRGITYATELWDWFHAGMHTLKIERRHISIVLGDDEFKQVKHWDLIDAYPVKWSGASLNTESNTVACETLELAHHGITISDDEGRPLGRG